MCRLLPLLLVLAACQPALPADALRAFDGGPSATAPPAAGRTAAAAATVRVNGHVVTVDVADTDASRRQGLSGRAGLGPDAGMVLFWPEPSFVAIWMPDMNFPLDVVFVRGERVVSITADAQPCLPGGPCPSFGPKSAVDWVLEVPAGSTARWGLAIGDRITLVR